MEKDNEVKGKGNSYDFGARMYDSRLGRWLSIDPKVELLVSYSPYNFAVNKPTTTIDTDGEFPIFINGNTSNDSERASPTYWDNNVLSSFKSYGYKLGSSFKGNSNGTSRFTGDYMFVDGNRGVNYDGDGRDGPGEWPSNRKRAGEFTAKQDAQMIWNKLKKSVNEDGEITEQIQIVTHSRGGAFGQGYISQLKKEISELSEKDGIGFAYDSDLVVDLVVHLAPHQSNYIDVPSSETATISVSHDNDYLSDMDVTGDVYNLATDIDNNIVSQYSHKNKTFAEELGTLLRQHQKNVTNGAPKYYGFKLENTENSSLPLLEGLKNARHEKSEE